MKKFEPFQKVVYRNLCDNVWSLGEYSHAGKDRHYIIGGGYIQDCNVLDYETHQHLVGKKTAPMWRAEDKGLYYFIDSEGDIKVTEEWHREIDDKRYNNCNYFISEAIARDTLNKINQTLFQ